MTLRLLLVAVLAAAIAGCGVKSDLAKPNGQPVQKAKNDPSRPPEPLGQ